MQPHDYAPAGTDRLLAGMRADNPATLVEHLARFGPLPARADLALVEQSGLRGRGGAAFSVAAKLQAVAASKVRAVVVANGAEGEPASGKDKALLRLAPHLVLDGVAAAAQCVGADLGIVAVSADARPELAALHRALAERPSDSVAVRIVTVPERFVTGEETALLNAIGGGPPKPTLKPPYPFQRGFGGAPTLVQNVETLAHLALVVRFGAEWFRSVGSADAPGTALVTVAGAVRRSGVYEIELGWSLGDVIRRAGGLSGAVSAVLVGGYFGSWVAPSDAPSLSLLPEVLGAGAIVALPAQTCALAECARVVRFLAGESAGQCGPCLYGLAAIADAFERLTAGDAGARRQLERWTAQVRGRGACKHPDGVVSFVESALTVFRNELDEHSRRGRCRKELRAVLPVPGRR